MNDMWLFQQELTQENACKVFLQGTWEMFNNFSYKQLVWNIFYEGH